MAEITLLCVSPADAAAVAAEVDLPEQNHRARADGAAVVLTYFDKRYPLNTAVWAAENGHASDDAAGMLIGRL